MSSYNYGFTGSSRGLGSSTIPSIGGSGVSSSLGLGGSRNVSSIQLEDAAFAARVLGLSGNLTSNLIGSSRSSTGVGTLAGSSYAAGLLSEPQQIRSLSRDVPSSTNYSDVGSRGRDSGYSRDYSPEGNARSYSRDSASRYDNQQGGSTYEQDRPRSDSRDNMGYRSPPPSSSDYDNLYSRQSGSGNDNRGSNRRDSDGGLTRQQKKRQRVQGQHQRRGQKQQQRGQQQQQRGQQQQQRNQQQQKRNKEQEAAQMQVTLQTQAQLQETLKRLQHLEEDQHKKDRKMQEMEQMLRKRKMEDEMNRRAPKQPRMDPMMSEPRGNFYDSPGNFGNFSPPQYPPEPRPPMRSPGGPPPMRSPGGPPPRRSPRGRLPMRSPGGRMPMRSPGGRAEPLMDFRGKKKSRSDKVRDRQRKQQHELQRGKPQRGRGGKPLNQGKRPPYQQQKKNQGQGNQQKKGNQQNRQGGPQTPQNKGKGGQQQRPRTQAGFMAKAQYHPDTVKQFGLEAVQVSYEREMMKVKSNLIKFDKPEPAKERGETQLGCFGCGKPGHKINECDDPNSIKSGRDNSATTVSHQVKLLTDMKYGMHIQDKKMYNLKCYICNFKCLDMEQYYLHLESKQHLATVDKVKGKVGDPGRLGLVQQLSKLPNIKMKDGLKDSGKYSYLCRICLEAVAGPASKHEETLRHKFKKDNARRCTICRIYFHSNGGLTQHEKSHLHELMRLEENKIKQEEKMAEAAKKKTEPAKSPSTATKPQEKTVKAQPAKTETGIPAGAIIGMDFVMQVSGWFCKVCQKFFPNVSKELHAATSVHHKKLWDYCKKKNMTLDEVLKKYLVEKPSDKDASGTEGTSASGDQKEASKEESKSDENMETDDVQGGDKKIEDAPESESKDAPVIESKDADVDTSMVIEKTDEGNEDEVVDIEGDEGEDAMELGDQDIQEVVDDGGNPMEDDELGEDEVGDDDMGDNVEEEDDLILEDTSAPVSSGVDEQEDVQPKENQEEAVKDEENQEALKDESQEEAVKEEGQEEVVKDESQEEVVKDESQEVLVKDESQEEAVKEKTGGDGETAPVVEVTDKKEEPTPSGDAAAENGGEPVAIKEDVKKNGTPSPAKRGRATRRGRGRGKAK